MSNFDEKTVLKKYLLGNLKEVEAIEKRILADEDYFQELEMVEEELIQDFADGNLSASEKVLFEQNFVLTPERVNKLSFAKNLRTYIDNNPKPISKPKKNGLIDSLRAFFSSPIPVACTVMLITGIAGYFVWNQYFRKPEILASLNKVQKNERPTEGRITGFDYAPKTEGTRGANDKTENLDLVSAKAQAAEALLKNETAENYHELGRVYLAEKNFDGAITNFEKGINQNANIARLHNDLGVALMEKANTKEDGKLDLLTKANEEFATAIMLDSKFLDAHFNQALCITLQNILPTQAKEAWQNYLNLDSTSKWADEARERTRKIDSTQPISKSKEEVLQEFLAAKEANNHEKAWQIFKQNRELVTGKLIPLQLTFWLVESKTKQNEADAKISLDALVYLGKLDEEKTGDVFLRDLAKYYQNVQNERIPNLKTAHYLLRKGSEFYRNGSYNEAKMAFENSKELFSLSKNLVEAFFCDYWLGCCFYYSSRITAHTLVFDKLLTFCESNGYKWLSSLAYARLGYSFSAQNRISGAIEYAKKGLSLANDIQDEISIRKISFQIADYYKSTGRLGESIRYLGSTSFYSATETTWLDYQTISNVLFRQKRYRGAFQYANEAYQKAVEIDSAEKQQISLVDLSAILISLKRPQEAEAYLIGSLAIAESFTDIENREKSSAYARLQLGNLTRFTDRCDESLNYYTDAINFYDLSEFTLDKYDAYRGRLLCFSKLKRDPEIESQLPLIFAMFEKYRSEILEEQNRNSFFNDEQDIYDIGIEYAATKSNYPQAFHYSEKSRSRSLLDLQNSTIEISTKESNPEIKLPASITEPLDLSQIQKEIPRGVQLLEFTVLNDRVLIWLISGDRLDVAQSETSSEALQILVSSFVDLTSKNQDEIEQKRLSKKLYEILINPISEKLAKEKELFIIPDKFLFRLPFSAISSDRYLIEDYKISVSPSASVFIFCSRKANQINSNTAENILSVGNPRFRQDLFEGLQPLPSAEKEAIEIAKYYENATVLIGEDATKLKLKENLRNANVFHFAGHYMVDEDSPLLSSFVLSGSDKEASNFANYEILVRKLTSARLIILSACQSGIEKYYNGEGMIGASRTFLAAGVPLVVATQWKADSEATSILMTNFHRFRTKEKRLTVDALRQSQLAMLRSDKHKQPYYWAVFSTLGGYTQF